MSEFRRVSKEKHKLFLSFYHGDDEAYRNDFALQFRRYYTSKSVEIGDIQEDISTEYIKRLIRENYIADASVVVVLVGPNTLHRKHVDWEISAGLEPGSGRSGLLGIILPEFPNYGSSYDPDLLPQRLRDNVDSGFAGLCWWSQVDGNPSNLVELVNGAFERRLDHTASNGRVQMHRNTGP